MSPDSEEGAEDTSVKEDTSAADKLTKDKVHVEELRLPEVMIPLTKTKGNNNSWILLLLMVIHMANC